jgi:hypothetical protein
MAFLVVTSVKRRKGYKRRYKANSSFYTTSSIRHSVKMVAVATPQSIIYFMRIIQA